MVRWRPKQKINRNRPTIGITGPDKGGEAAWLFTALGVWRAGGKPVRITPARPRTADGLQGLIIGGGADVDPSIYKQQDVIEDYLSRTIRQPQLNLLQKTGRLLRWLYFPVLFFVRKLFSRKLSFGLDRRRDHLELQLLDQAAEKDLPLMGICRGAQLLNVYFGGSLHEHLEAFYDEEPNPASIFPVKQVYLQHGSKLAQVLGANRLAVNALHKQAVKEAGTGIGIVGQEANQVVQAIEHGIHTYMVGVQWHPEYLPQYKVHRRLFKALVQEARLVKQQIEEQDMRRALAQPEQAVLRKLHRQP